jgi:nicotinamide mononucleotide transporter
MSLNWFFYVPFQFIGFYIWSKSMNIADDNELEVKSLSDKGVLVLSMSLIGGIVLLGTVLSTNGGAHPATDASNVMLSIIATYLMAKGYREQWLCWIAVNVTGIAMWTMATVENQGPGLSSLAMWVAFFINSVYGLYRWSVKYQQAKLLNEAKAW